MRISLVIPSYRRPKDLQRALKAVEGQSRRPDEVIVVVRDTDHETWQMLKTLEPNLPRFKTCEVVQPGLIAALNAGLAQVDGDIVCFTDDDAVPAPDWIARIEATYAAHGESLGGVGGKDNIVTGGKRIEGRGDPVGSIAWYGRRVGNHHLGFGPAREVDILKGVNMSYRMTALGPLRFDERMMGSRSQSGNEISLCLPLRRRGFRLIYDPAIQVDHYISTSGETGHRSAFPENQSEIIRNETLLMLEHFGCLRSLVYLLWGALIGTRAMPGLVQLVRLSLRYGGPAWGFYLATRKGRFHGIGAYFKAKRARISSSANGSLGDGR